MQPIIDTPNVFLDRFQSSWHMAYAFGIGSAAIFMIRCATQKQVPGFQCLGSLPWFVGVENKQAPLPDPKENPTITFVGNRIVVSLADA